MRHLVIKTLAAVLTISAAMESAAQTVTEVTPSVIGISINPGTSRASLRSSGGPILDGDRITFDLGGADETTFEFDYSGGGAPTVTPGAIPVDMPSSSWGDHVAAREALVQAVNNTASCPVKLAGYSNDSSNYFAIV